MKLLSIIILSLVACSPLKQPLSTFVQPDPAPPYELDPSRFADPKDQRVYDAYKFGSSYTDFPENPEAFDATCYILDKNEKLVGTGTLITTNSILTAAHVAYSVVDGYIQFDKGGTLTPIHTVWMHPEWLMADDMSKDIALLKLDCEVVDRLPMSIADSDDDLFRYDSDIFTIGCSLHYKKQSLPSVMIYYGKLVTAPTELKLRSTFTTIWFGDSGGPVVLKDPDGTFIVIGVTTRFSMFQQEIMDFTAMDVRSFSSLLNSVMNSWEEEKVGEVS